MEDKIEMVNIMDMRNKLVMLDMVVSVNMMEIVYILMDMVDKVNMDNMLVDTSMVDIVAMMKDQHV